MAKVKAPLFSFEARGALGEAIVYFPWKGIDCVRQYVIPTNPKSTLQTAQRNKLTKAVDQFHTSAYSSLDMSAWTRFAGTLALVMTGFNAMCREHIKAVLKNPAAVWNSLGQINITSITPTGCHISPLKSTKADNYLLYYGTKETYMPTKVTDESGPPDVGFLLLDLTPNTDYYFYIYATAGNRVARTGIYKHRTPAA